MGHFVSRTAAAIALVLVSSSCAHAQLGVGARAFGMGGAFTAVADDIYAQYWNPAGIAQLHGIHGSLFNAQARLLGPNKFSDLTSNFPSDTQSQIDFARRFTGGVSQGDVSGHIGFAYNGYALSILPFATGTVTPLNANGTIGIPFQTEPFTGLQVPQPGSKVIINGVYGGQMMATVTSRVDPRTQVGANLKIVNFRPANVTVTFNTPSAQAPSPAVVTNSQGDSTTAFAADLGVLHHISRRCTIGATLFNAVRPNVNGLFDTRLAVGGAYRPSHTLLLAADLDEVGGGGTTRLNLGVEYKPLRYIALRTGLYRGRPTIGLGIAHVFDIAYVGNQSLFSVSASF